MLWIIRTYEDGPWLLAEADTAIEAASKLQDKWFPAKGVSRLEIVMIVDAREDAS